MSQIQTSIQANAAVTPRSLLLQNAVQTGTNAIYAQGATGSYNTYNPYVQSSYQQALGQIIDDWQLEKTYCINGMWMNLAEFADYVYPEQCTEKTFLILRLKGQKDAD